MLFKDLPVIFKIKICSSCIHDKQILFNNKTVILFNNNDIIIINKLYRLIIDFFKDSLRITLKKIKISRLSIKIYIE